MQTRKIPNTYIFYAMSISEKAPTIGLDLAIKFCCLRDNWKLRFFTYSFVTDSVLLQAKISIAHYFSVLDHHWIISCKHIEANKQNVKRLLRFDNIKFRFKCFEYEKCWNININKISCQENVKLTVPLITCVQLQWGFEIVCNKKLSLHIRISRLEYTPALREDQLSINKFLTVQLCKHSLNIHGQTSIIYFGLKYSVSIDMFLLTYFQVKRWHELVKHSLTCYINTIILKILYF